MKKIFFYLLILIVFGGCAKHSLPPAKIWGMVGASYEATKESGSFSKKSKSASAVSTLKIEKNVGGFGFGGEVGGRI